MPRLKIIQLNINSLISKVKQHELQEFLKLHKPDILLLNETKLNYNNTRLFQNYEFVRSDRINGEGGGLEY